MPYATQQDLVDRYGADEIRAVSDRADPPLDAIDAAVVAKALADAGEEIDGYLAKRYALPIAGTVPPVLTTLACEIARFRLQRNIPSEDLSNGYTRAIKRLQEIAAGQFVLQLAGTEPAGGGQATAEIEVPPRLFTRDTMTGF
jgi:phage gp36-like protein